MTSSDPREDREDLDRLVDGTLDPDRRALIAARVAADPDAAAEVAALERVDRLLRARFADVADEPVPVFLLRAATRGRVLRGWKTPWRLARIAATLLVVAGLGALGGWYVRGLPTAAPVWVDFARAAAAAHRTYAPDRDFPAGIAAEPSARLFARLARRIGTPVRAPASLGDYRLIGGGLLPADDGPAALFMYEKPGGDRLTLYLRSDLVNRDEVTFQVRREGDVNVLYWLDGPRGYALSGDVTRGVLLRIADGLYEAIGS